MLENVLVRVKNVSQTLFKDHIRVRWTFVVHRTLDQILWTISLNIVGNRDSFGMVNGQSVTC